MNLSHKSEGSMTHAKPKVLVQVHLLWDVNYA